MQQYTIYPLVVGINETDQGVMTYLRETNDQTVLVILNFSSKKENFQILF